MATQPTATSALRNVFGSAGLQGLLPPQNNLTDILSQLGVNVPEPLQGMGASQIGQVLNLENKLTQSAPATFQTYFDDPGKVASFVTSMWREFNKEVQDQGGQPVGILQFVQAAGFAPQVQEMFSTMFGGTAGAAGNSAEAALSGAIQ